MTPEFKKYESHIKKKHSFNWTPKFKKSYQTKLSQGQFVAIALNTIEELGWDLVFQDENTVEAKCKGDDWQDKWTEKISINFDYGDISVKSVSLGQEMWDNGRNSKRVLLFIYAFKTIADKFDSAELIALENDLKKANNWDDYYVPENLLQPQERRKRKFWIPVIGGLVLAIVLGYIVAFLTVNIGQIIFLYEIVVGVIMGFGLRYLIQLGNYTIYHKLRNLLIVMVIITYVCNLYFQYDIIKIQHGFSDIGFYSFLKIKLSAGLTIKSFEFGWIGLVLSWILQFVLTYIVGDIRLATALTVYKLQRIPMEVVDFAFYHFAQDKSEEQVRNELSKMGWDKEEDQNEVFESIGAIYEANAANRFA